VKGGQIVSANTGGNQNEYCLDVFRDWTSEATPIDLAPCNGTQAQVFWMAGFTMGIGSTLVDPANDYQETLDVLWNNESPGATLDDYDFNGSNAQWFVLNGSRQITLANNPSLCVALNSNPVNGTSSVALETCNVNASQQQWSLANKSVNVGGCPPNSFACPEEIEQSTFVNNNGGGCLDIFADDSASLTTVDVYTCTPNNGAQLWVPFMPFNAPKPPVVQVNQ
jgi:hypothetical protein